MANIYIGSVQHAAVAQWAASTAYVSTANGGRGDYVRQLAAPAVGSERVYRCTTSGTSGGTEPASFATGTKNQVITDNTATWTECTGQEADQISGTWKAPHARLRNAYVATWGAAGDRFYLAPDHAATEAAALTLTNPGTLASPCQVLCVRIASGTVPPVDGDLSTGATETNTGSNVGTLSGCFVSDGVSYSFGSGAISNNNILGGGVQSDMIFRNGAISCPATVTPTLLLGSTNNSIGTRIVFEKNFKWNPGSATSTLLLQTGGDFIWKDTATAVGGTVPTNLFGASVNGAGTVLCDGVDFIALNTKTLVAATAKFGVYTFKDCKLPASITICAAPTSAAVRATRIRSASGATAYDLSTTDTRGNQTTEVTIVRTGGKTINGTAVAMKMVATANASFQSPFESMPIIVNNTTTAANVIVTVYGIWAGGAIPTNAELWLEIGYLGSSATPILTFDNSTRKSGILAAAATVAVTDSSTWGGSTTKFKWAVTLSSPQPALAGEMYIVVKGCTTNATYIDPKAYLS